MAHENFYSTRSGRKQQPLPRESEQKVETIVVAPWNRGEQFSAKTANIMPPNNLNVPERTLGFSAHD
jgi:hypothetical protein